jgi:methyl-accepting chemotaxis protein
MKNLATRSREATAQIRDILQEIQQATDLAVTMTEEGTRGAHQGAILVNRAGEAIRDLTTTIEEAAQAAGEIAITTRQQTNGMKQLVASMRSIRDGSR